MGAVLRLVGSCHVMRIQSPDWLIQYIISPDLCSLFLTHSVYSVTRLSTIDTYFIITLRLLAPPVIPMCFILWNSPAFLVCFEKGAYLLIMLKLWVGK